MYHWNARDYRAHSSEQQRWARELILKLHLKGEERILDIGCGDGKVTAEIAESVPGGSVLGIDNSREMILLARETFPRDRFPRLTFERKDARDLDFDEAFDVVFSNATLHWVVDHRPMLGGIRKSLRPAGKTLLQMGGLGNGAGVVEVLEGMIRSERWRSYFNGFSFPYGFHEPQEYRIWLKEAGLKASRVELFPKDMVHKGTEEFSGWIRTTWLPYTERIPENHREEFVAEMTDRYVESHPAAKNGSIHVRMVRLEVEAEKGTE